MPPKIPEHWLFLTRSFPRRGRSETVKSVSLFSPPYLDAFGGFMRHCCDDVILRGLRRTTPKHSLSAADNVISRCNVCNCSLAWEVGERLWLRTKLGFDQTRFYPRWRRALSLWYVDNESRQSRICIAFIKAKAHACVGKRTCLHRYVCVFCEGVVWQIWSCLASPFGCRRLQLAILRLRCVFTLQELLIFLECFFFLL